jgi:uncharacterized protein (TIGR02391 family)
MVMHWDDLQLLHMIDHLEESEIGTLTNGQGLMQRIADGQQLDYSRDYRTFAWELILAYNAGFVTWDGRGVYSQSSDPFANPNSWLQEIRDIRLTLAGRDRARGRVVMNPLPNPDEDDDRQIAGMSLEEIARSIGDSYTPSQLPRFLLDSGIPEEYLAPTDASDKWVYVLVVFERLHDGGSAARGSLREFIGKWLENRLHTGPRDDVRRRILVQLARQGWFAKDGRLVIGDPQFGDVPLASPLGREARIAALHPVVRQVSDRYIESNHMSVATLEAFKAVNNWVKELTGLGSDGAELMGKAFGGSKPRLLLAEQSTQTGRDIQSGFLQLFVGAVKGIRNPNAHEPLTPLDDNEALEQLTFASMLMHRLDAAVVASE